MATMTENDGDNGEQLVIVETDPNAAGNPAEGTGAEGAGNTEQHHDDDDERLNGGADDEVNNAADDAEREAIRERRRLEKLERKERREQAIKRDKLELDFLRKRNDDLERRLGSVEQRTVQADIANIDARIIKAQQDAEMAERVMAKAIEAGNGADAAQALRYRDQAREQLNLLAAQKQQTLRAAQAPQPGADGLDDMTLHYAQQFIKDNSWYDPQGRNEDSAIVLAIDQGLVRDGYLPNTPEYWDELRSRAARRLPERFAAQQSRSSEPSGEPRAERTPRGGPAVGSGREHAPASTRKEVYISPERKQALIEAGVWDDPVLRMKYVKRYAEYDRNNRA